MGLIVAQRVDSLLPKVPHLQTRCNDNIRVCSCGSIDLAHDPALVQEFQSSLLWGLSDPHPWTRREALRAFRRAPEFAKRALDGLVDISSYPGLLDLYLECSQHGLSPEKIIRAQDVPPKSLEAFHWAVGRPPAGLSRSRNSAAERIASAVVTEIVLPARKRGTPSLRAVPLEPH